MRIQIDGAAEEIAALVLALQGRPDVKKRKCPGEEKSLGVIGDMELIVRDGVAFSRPRKEHSDNV